MIYQTTKEIIDFIKKEETKYLIQNPPFETMQLKPLTEIEEYFKPLFETDNEVKTFLSEEFLNDYGLEISVIQCIKPDYLPYGTVRVLLKHHFDVFGLIDKGLATYLKLKQ